MYYIYHVEGIKIGCTDNVEQRIKAQGYEKYEILEEHTDIYVASDRELALQKEYGYRIDPKPYYKMIEWVELPKRLTAIKNSKLIKEAGKNALIIGKTKENQSKNGKKGGKIAGKILYKQSKGLFAMSEEDKFKARSKAGKVAGKIAVESGHLERVRSIIRTCPHCNIKMKGQNYFRYHGDRCKAKPQ